MPVSKSSFLPLPADDCEGGLEPPKGKEEAGINDLFLDSDINDMALTSFFLVDKRVISRP